MSAILEEDELGKVKLGVIGGDGDRCAVRQIKSEICETG